MFSHVKVWGVIAGVLSLCGSLNSQSQFSHSDDIYWDTTIATSGGGLDGRVRSLTMYDGKLIAAGNFTSAGGSTANHIAAWDGSSWSALGSNMYGAVGPLTVYNSQLIAGGGITTADGDSVNYIAAWDGTSWSSLGAGLDGPLTALSEYDGKLIAGYYVQRPWPFGQDEAHISSWDGSAWSPLAVFSNGSISYSVNGLAVYNNALWASIYANYGDGGYGSLFTLGGSNWLTVRDGGGGGPMYVFDDKLLVTTMQCSINFCWGGLIVWDGSVWADLSIGGYFQWALAFEKFHGKLVVAGDFSSAQDVIVNNIADTWDCDHWSPLGSGIGGGVYALTEYDSLLTVGGYFTTAGGKSSPYIAQWTKRPGFCGDADASYFLDISDAVYLIDYIYGSGPAPNPAEAGDPDCSGNADISDVVYLIAYIFQGGPVPCAGC